MVEQSAPGGNVPQFEVARIGQRFGFTVMRLTICIDARDVDHDPALADARRLRVNALTNMNPDRERRAAGDGSRRRWSTMSSGQRTTSSSANGRVPRPFNVERFPHVAILAALSPEDPCRVVTLAGSAQIGKTVIANIFLGGSMAMDTCDFPVFGTHTRTVAAGSEG